ncbi:putative protein phosphatase 2C 8 isoform X2 [Silene latifolia]|uniref:putative protein phosphatase 2C 8 isoform X2 n=1 Tax=Silene latifolia TaxID=37657 RepID=UPI003D787203
MEKNEGKMSNPPTIEHGLISVIGRRRSMEDAFTVYPNLVRLKCDVHEHKHKHEDEHENKKGKKQVETSYDFFAVFDGHGSNKVSDRCKERLHHLVADEMTRVERGAVDVDWQSVMANSFARMEAEVTATLSSFGRKKVGATALVVVVVGTAEIVVASFGDCRVVLFRDDASLQLSRCPKVERSAEQERTEAGGINLRDLLSEAEVEVCKRNGLDDFIVIGTDGLWDVIDNDTAGDMVRKCFRGQVSKTVLEGVDGNCAAAAATMLAELAIARGSRDNISVIVVQLRAFDANSSSFTK